MHARVISRKFCEGYSSILVNCAAGYETGHYCNNRYVFFPSACPGNYASNSEAESSGTENEREEHAGGCVRTDPLLCTDCLQKMFQLLRVCLFYIFSLLSCVKVFQCPTACCHLTPEHKYILSTNACLLLNKRMSGLCFWGPHCPKVSNTPFLTISKELEIDEEEPLNFSRVDVLLPKTKILACFPSFPVEKNRSLECVVHEGNMLYLPAGKSHNRRAYAFGNLFVLL